jgi:aspartate aminotransferase-like enzyme
VVTAFLVPDGVDGKAIPAELKRRFGVQIAGGQGKLAGRICRIGHCGYYDYRDILTALGALEIVLADLGHLVEAGAGVAAAQRVAADALAAPSPRA